MLRKFIYGLMGGVVFFLVLGVLGAFIGMYIGGAFFEGMEFAGLHDYEAGGNIGLWVLGAVGAMLGIRLGVKLSDPKRPRTYKIILIVAFILAIALLLQF